MMYAFVGFFDHKTEQNLRNLWKQLSQHGISHYSEESQHRRPHITIADYDHPDKNKFIALMDEFYGTKPQVEVTFNGLGTFLGSGTLFISPTVSTTLSDFHEGHHDAFKHDNKDPNSFYLPGKWVPHCTIANRLSHEKLVEAFDYCSNNLSMSDTRITEVALLELIYDDGKCVSSPTVYSKKLK